VPLAWRTAGALSIAVLLTAHVGTSDFFFAGSAGPWNVRVSIRQPGVIPGLADISVRVAEPGVEQVLVTARLSREGGGAAPPPDVATEVRGETGLYAAQLWLMNPGTHEVAVTVEGTAGQGVARIPIVAAATRQLEMARGLQFLILGGGLFLVLGLLTIVGTASRESVLPAGTQPLPADRRRAWRATAVATLVLGLALYGGWTWVRAESELHRSRLDRPWSSMATMHERGESRVLEFAITEPLWVNRDDDEWRDRNLRYRRADLIPDHGKMMHMFVVRDADMAAFAHIHPERLDANRFAVAFPPLPPGPYRVYADVTHEDGYAHTLVASVEAAAPEAAPMAPQSAEAIANSEGDEVADPVPDPAADPDDAWWIAATAVRPDGADSLAAEAAVPSTPVAGVAATRLTDGSVMRWLNADEPLAAGRDADLVIRVEDVEGRVVALDPYMGMQGHAMLSRTDGEVFVHLHPSGMISMAAQSVLNTAVTGMSGMHEGMDMSASANVIAGGDGTIRFPFAVPAAGPYRIWVQVRRGDSILTGSFDTVIVDEVG
jgi:hypothetical protein